MKLGTVLAFALLLAPTPAQAVTPDEILPDPALEQRARALSAELRCMVCQNQSIDDSNADLAKDLRVLVRERLKAGDSNQQVLDFVVARYGEFVLLKPQFETKTILLWGFPVLILLIGAGFLVVSARRKPAAPILPLSDEERRKLAEIMPPAMEDEDKQKV
ncbi:cytochrome c-type biogenesis protein CcmH [Phyllobacterium salinisoli]|uniref:Cytochrome c-type biogenesis protein n=1 Tax=Phyllobacterium salinisoli TaxID=1899321 RepID=A0A368K2T2_9HYPH|nr:cytochrome c-type biogenesis protein [Phyllobacterium salinisoli]RCS23531.1 cytochrome c-type biogenesis protein CcmH [Phyllobacterium salinisoli]